MAERASIDASKPPAKPDGLAGVFAGGGVLAGLAGATCCILPIALANLGASTALLLHLRFFVRNQLWFSAAALALVALAAFLAFRGGRRPSRLVIGVLALSGLLAAASFIVPHYEAELVRWAYGR
jgi:hypothetical protein